MYTVLIVEQASFTKLTMSSELQEDDLISYSVPAGSSFKKMNGSGFASLLLKQSPLPNSVIFSI